jgi:hypothetical protein
VNGAALTRRRCLRALALAAPVLIAGCATGKTGTGGTSGGTAPGPAGPAPAWLLARSALAQVAQDDDVAAGLSRARVYELLQPGQQPLSLAGALPAVIFASAAELADVVGRGGLPAGTRAVVYDPEAWPFTPRSEQLDPAAAAKQAAGAAHAQGLQLVVAPALNLTTVLAPGAAGPRSETFLQLGLAASLARFADVLEFQAQSLERDAGTYAHFVAAAAAQARGSRPGVGVLAGVSTNPPGEPVTSAELVAAIQASRASVDGYWLNIPGVGPRCPTCNPPRPDIGIQTLQAVLPPAPQDS